MKIDGIVNEKGGVAKTTTAINLAATFARKKQRVLLIDADPQGNATTYLGLPPEPGFYALEATTVKAIRTLIPGDPVVHIRSFLRETGRENLTLLPGSADTATAQALILQEEKDPLRIRKAILKNFKGMFDRVIIDTSPSLGGNLELIMMAADYIITPSACETASVEGAIQTFKTLEHLKKAGWKGKFLGVIPAFYDKRIIEKRESLVELERLFGDAVLPVIHESAAIRELPSNQMTIFEKADVEKGKYTQRAAKEFEAVAKEILRRS